MRWTKRPPTEPGWYWWRMSAPYRASVLWLWPTGEVWMRGSGVPDPLETRGGEWYGPLSEPEGDAEDCTPTGI